MSNKKNNIISRVQQHTEASSDHQQDPLFPDEKEVASPVLLSDKNKGQQKEHIAKSINKKIRLTSASDKQYRSSKATKKETQPISLSDKSKTQYGARASTEKNKQASIDLAIIPLYREDMKALVHHDMQVSSYPESRKSKDPSNKWSIWLQLNVPLPLYGTKYYTTGPKGTDAFYRNLIPSLRLERAIGKSVLSIDLHPYNATILPVKRAAQSSEKHLVKQFGPEMLLLYHYPVYENLHVAAGSGASWWKKAIVEQIKDTMPSSVINIIPATDTDRKNYARFLFTANVEMYYDLNKW